MIKSEPFACQYWAATNQQWVLNIRETFSTILEAKDYGRERYKEFRVIEQGVIRYTRIYEDGVLVESVGDSVQLETYKGSTLEQALARQAKRERHDNRASASVLENISGELGGISIALSEILYGAKVLGSDILVNHIQRQRSLLNIQINRIDGIVQRLEADNDVQDNS